MEFITEVLSDDNYKGENKLLGYEQENTIIFRRVSERDNFPYTDIYCLENGNFKKLHEIKGTRNVIQASVNHKRNILVFVTKDESYVGTTSDHHQQYGHLSAFKYVYNFHCVSLDANNYITDLEIATENQMMAQFLYRKKQIDEPDKFVVLIHQHSITLYEISKMDDNSCRLYKIIFSDTLTKAFAWAQWNVEHQCLFYIHYRQVQHNTTMDEERETLLTSQREDPPVPILTVFQFHDDMPHETVLNLPLHLSRVMNKSSSVKLRYNYVDSPVPLRVCDTTMNVVVLMRSLGDFYVCYYYTFQQTEFDKNAAENAKVNEIASGRINFAYSVILLHHGIVLNCTVPSVPCNLARKIDPVFCLYKDQHLMVYADGMFTHLLDVGIEHEPCCHILMPSRCLINSNYNGRLLVPVPGKTTVLINSTNLDLIELSIKKEQLIEVFTNGGATTTTDKLSILHYLLVHENEISAVGRILTSVVEMLPDLCISNLFKEILVGNCYAVLNRFLSADAMPLLRLLPLSTLSANIKYESKADKYELVLEEELMSNASVILLTPRQRLIPFRSDIWMKLWDLLPDHRVNNYRLTRFKNSAVTEKLSVSLICYQPEALSRCTTPLSPGAPHIASTGMLADLANMSRSNKFGIDPLPFVEIEASAASKQEHVISVNLREISMHLVKHGQTPMQVHAVSTRYVSAQLETARLLCSFLTKAVSIDTRYGERGFQLIDNLEQKHRRIFFAILERYYLAVDTLSFPLPQGFPSFFAYLGYKTLPMNKFVDYGRANVFQLNIDVMKTIMTDLSSDEKDELRFKLSLLSHLPRSRVKRLMNQWSHPVSLMIRAREHSLNIVSGISVINHRASNQSRSVRHNFSGKGVAAFPSEERLSPLDTFLELLTAKANLSEIDFNLLIEATAASTKEFL